MKKHFMFAVTAGAVAVVSLAGCGNWGSSGSTPPPSPRSSQPAGPEYAQAARYLAAHPRHAGRGMAYGILVQQSGPGYACLGGWCRTWHGVVVVPGDRLEQLASDTGDNGMSAIAQPGDEIVFPAGGPVDAESDADCCEWAAGRVVLAGAATP